jgi:hypothetical protein
VIESKKDIAISFLKLASGGKVREAFSKFVGAGFRHHTLILKDQYNLF